jgi:hypothetical protein
VSDVIASLGLSIDSSQAASAATTLDKLTAAGQKASDAADQLAVSGAKSETVLRAIQAAADRSGVSFDTMNQRVDDASTSANNSAAANTKAAGAVDTHTKAHNNLTPAVHGSGSELGKWDEIAAILESRLLRLGNNVGLFGELLQVIGPGGLAAAAGLGAAVVAVDQLVTSANRMGDFAQQLQNMSTLTGLSVTSLQSLVKTNEEFGVSGQQTGQFLEQFSRQLDAVRNGTGTLRAELLKIDPALLAQLSVTKDSTTALNLLAAAYAKAGASQNALAAAAGGGSRNGAQNGLLLGAVASAGSVQAINAAAPAIDQITTTQTAAWAKLDGQITSTFSDAKNNFASIFTGPVLEAESKFADGLLDISRNAKSFALSSDFQKMIDFVKLGWSVSNALTVPSRSKPVGIDLSTSDIGAGMTSGLYHPPIAEGPPAPVLGSPADQAKNASDMVSFLGSAATATDRYNASVLKLNADVANNTLLMGGLDRAMAGLGLDKAASDASTYASALGGLATTQDKVNVVATAFQKQMSVNKNLTTDQLTGVKLIAQANDEWSRASASAQLGVFNLGAAQKAVNDQMEVAIREKLLDPTNLEQYGAAVQATANKVQALSDAAAVAGSKFPQLTQFGLDASNVNKQFDTFGTTSLTNFSDALVAIGTHASTAGAAFTSFGLQVLSSLEKMIIQLTIMKPLSDAVGIGGGGLLGLLGIGSATGAVAANGSLVGAVGGTSIGGAPLVFAAAGGGTFGPGWGVVGEQGPELIKVHNGGVTVIPNNISKPYLPGFAAGGMLSPSGNVSRMPGMGQDNTSPVVNIYNTNDFRGADPGSEARINQRIDAMGKQAVNQAVQAVANIKGTSPSYLQASR